MHTRQWFSRRFLLCAILGLIPAASARADSPLVGAWESALKPPVGPAIKVVLRVEADKEGALRAQLDSPDQDTFDMKIDEVTLDGDKVTISAKDIRLKFEGTLNESHDEIKGTWSQGIPFEATFKRGDPATVAKAKPLNIPAELEGLWQGTLQVQAGIELRLVLNVHKAKGDDERLTAVLDSPDQGANGLPVTTLSLEDGTLRFTMKSIRAEFEGKKTEQANAFKGTFTQVGRKFPLTLTKVNEVKKANRPQEPKPPFPYRSEEVAYENQAGGVKLAGTLTIPAEGEAPFPAVILITGSGPQDRDEQLLGHKPFLVLADHLTRRGLAVLRVDDRGVGGSTGDISTSTSDDFAGDVLAGVAYLKTRPEVVDPTRIGLCGHSEGGLIAPIVAARAPNDIAFIVLMAGTGVPGTDILRLQSREIARAMGAKEKSLETQAEILERTFEIIDNNPDNEAAKKALVALNREALSKLSAEERVALDIKDGDDGDDQITTATAQMLTPWFRYFLNYDPRPTLSKVQCPVLAINGEKDLQVIPSQNLPEIEKALRGGGNTQVKIIELPGLNHLFQPTKTGAPSEYGKIEETIDPAALQAITDWLVETVAK